MLQIHELLGAQSDFILHLSKSQNYFWRKYDKIIYEILKEFKRMTKKRIRNVYQKQQFMWKL